MKETEKIRDLETHTELPGERIWRKGEVKLQTCFKDRDLINLESE